MKIRNKILSLMAAVAVSTAICQAEEVTYVNALEVHLNDGSVELYNLPDTPEVTFDGEQMTVASQAAQAVYSTRDVSHFEINPQAQTSISAPAEAVEAAFTLTFVDNATLEVTSPALTLVELYTIGGVKVASVPAAGGSASVSLADLPAGVYIVAPDCHEAVKVVKR